MQLGLRTWDSRWDVDGTNSGELLFHEAKPQITVALKSWSMSFELCSFTFLKNLFWFIWVSCMYIYKTWFLACACQFLKNSSWDFDRDYFVSADQFRDYSHLNDIKSSNLWVQDVFPFTAVYFNFFLWCFVIFQVLLFVKRIPYYFSLLDTTEPVPSFHLQMASVYKFVIFSYFNITSYNLAKFLYLFK